MSQPATPRTTIPTITTETHRSSPGYVLQYSNSGFTQCRIEESQRTIFLPPDSQLQLHTHAGDNPVNVTIIPENGSYVPRRTRSLELLSPVNQPQVEPPSPSCSHHSTASFAPRSPLSAKPPITRHVPPATPTSFSRRSWTPRAQPTRILFYHKHDPHYGFTNFSPHPVMYKGKRYPTSEHLFQSFKFQEHRPGLAEHVRTCSEWPSMAFSEARRFQPEARRDWQDVNIQKMDETLFYKFTQHKDLREELLATGDAELVEDSDKDAFWGVGADGKGRNELGKALERLRAKLRGHSII